jgi:hypothetical protein
MHNIHLICHNCKLNIILIHLWKHIFIIPIIISNISLEVRSTHSGVTNFGHYYNQWDIYAPSWMKTKYILPIWKDEKNIIAT